VPGKRIEFQYGEQAPIVREFNRISAREKRERFLALYEALKEMMDALEKLAGGLPDSTFTDPYFKMREAIASAEGRTAE